MQTKKIVTCACGYEARGCDDEIVRIMQRHGREAHNMDATAEQILAMARDWDDAPFDVEGPVQADRGWAEALRDYTPEPFRHLR